MTASSDPSLPPAEARRARQAERVREDILEAAARAFTRSGYQATTMRAIAKEAGFTASSLYTYFDSKEAIFLGLLQQLGEEIFAVLLERMPQGLSFEQKVELVLLRHTRLVERRRSAFAFLASQEVCGSPHGEQLKAGHLRYLEALERWMRDNASESELGGVQPEEAACALWGLQHGFFARWMHTGAEGDLVAMVPLILKIFTRGLT